MTLSNGASGPSDGLSGTTPTAAGGYYGIQMPTGLDFSASANMQILLQTNNDLILAIHKAFVENTQDTNRKIESLRDDIRDIKLNLQKNDATLKEEAGEWRSHTELLLKEQGERHLQDSSRLSDMLMKLVIGGGGMGISAPFYSAMPPHFQPLPPLVSMQTQAQAPPQPQWLPPPAQPPPPTSIVTTVSYALPITTMTTTSGSGTSVFPPISASVMPNKPSLVPFLYQKTPPSLISVTKVSTPFQPELPMPASTLSVATPLTTSTTIIGAPGAVPPPATIGTSTGTTSTGFFGIAGTEEIKPSAFKFSANLPATVTVSVTTTPAGTTTSTTPSFGGSFLSGVNLFGDGTKSAGTNSFADLAAKANESGGRLFGPGTSGGNILGGGAKPQFGPSPFTKANIFAPSPATQSSGTTGRGRGGGDDESDKEDDEEEYSPDAHFEPVIELPPEVEVVSGEENEETIFVARCKLYRYDRELKENKERGLGDIKILKNPITQKYRCVMRREKVFKLCANFPILGDLKVQQREHMPTVYTWACKDFSENLASGDDETFNARFKDVSIATEFNEKIKEAVQATKQQQD